MRRCPKFTELEIEVLRGLLEASFPHSPGDLVAVEVHEIPQPHRYIHIEI